MCSCLLSCAVCYVICYMQYGMLCSVQCYDTIYALLCGVTYVAYHELFILYAMYAECSTRMLCSAMLGFLCYDLCRLRYTLLCCMLYPILSASCQKLIYVPMPSYDMLCIRNAVCCAIAIACNAICDANTTQHATHAIFYILSGVR